MTRGDLPQDLQQKAWQICSQYEKAIENEVRSRNLVPGIFPALNPCNLLVVLDSQNLYVAFTHMNAGGVPRQIWVDRRTMTFNPQQVLQSAVTDIGMVGPSLFHISAAALNTAPESREPAIKQAALGYVNDISKALTRPQVLTGYEYAICVFEEMDEREFNPNVPLEYGFMRAMNRQV